MKKFLLLCFLFCSNYIFPQQTFTTNEIKVLYDHLKYTDTKPNYDVFLKALKGYNKIENKNDKYIVIIDFSLPSDKKRFYVIDLATQSVDYNTYVSHGKNSGTVEAISFSDTRNSFQSSLGFFVTLNSYDGKYGYSLRINGLEPGINSNAYDRSIVIHGADYATKDFIDKYGFLGRSLGCPAIPLGIANEVIDHIKEGTVLFIYGNDPKYFATSKFLK